MSRNVKQVRLLQLGEDIAACRYCAAQLAHEPRPVVQIGAEARLLIIGQAPGTRVHASGIPWDDASGDRLRQWLGMDKARFYDSRQVAIMSMGFCYPGRGRGGDLPPRPECAPRWHQRILEHLPKVQLTLLVGGHAQRYYLGNDYPTLSQRLQHWRDYGPHYFPLVHPSPRNRHWLDCNPWFEAELVPALQKTVRQIFIPA